MTLSSQELINELNEAIYLNKRLDLDFLTEVRDAIVLLGEYVDAHYGN